VLLGSDSNTDELTNIYHQHLHSSLQGKIRELESTDDSDDTDTRFQPPRDPYNEEPPSAEGYRFENSRHIIPAISVSVAKEALLERHKRQAQASIFGSSSTAPMDGSGATEEGNKCFLGYYFYTERKILIKGSQLLKTSSL
jgi:hypothetical protein